MSTKNESDVVTINASVPVCEHPRIEVAGETTCAVGVAISRDEGEAYETSWECQNAELLYVNAYCVACDADVEVDEELLATVEDAIWRHMRH